MRVWYITMVFPVSTETFACLDVRALRRAGVAVSVHAMRAARPWGLGGWYGPFAFRARTRAAKQLLAERDVGDVPVTHSTPAAVLRGLWVAVRSPGILIGLVAWLLRMNWRSPVHLLKSVVFLPRSLDLLASVRARRPDVVHLFWGHYPAIVGYLVRRYHPEVVLSMFLGAHDLRVGYPGSAAVARTADVVWTHAKANVPAIERLGVPPGQVRLAYRGIDLEAFSGRAHLKVAHRLVTAGRLDRAKAVDDVLRVFATLVRRWPSASLVILGDGPERSRLVRLAASLGITGAVRFQGHVSPARLRDEMGAAQVLVLMSVTECLPNVVKEAMASRCVCVVSATVGIEELVEDGKNGFVVKQGDIADAARCIDHVFQHPDEAAATASAARGRIVANFDVRRSMEAYRERWRELRLRRIPQYLPAQGLVGLPPKERTAGRYPTPVADAPAGSLPVASSHD